MGSKKQKQTPTNRLLIDGETWKYETADNGFRVTTPNDRTTFIGNAALYDMFRVPRYSINCDHLVEYIRRKHAMLTRKRAKGERSLTIGNECWGWRVGKKNVLITAPTGKKTAVPLVNEQEIGHITRWDERLEMWVKVVKVVDLPNREITIEVDGICGCCSEPDGSHYDITLPSVVKSYITRHRAELM